MGADDLAGELTRRDRILAARQLDAMARELDAMSCWLSLLTDSGTRKANDAAKAATVMDHAAAYVRSACWLIAPFDGTLPGEDLAGRISRPPDGWNT
ncbi:MAG TPA: hypothetical protein VME19_17765 [Streptosporangiaceae bacterium]|nr:hypothetical protein [Streptosporangiaceae bacterium]